MTKTQRTTKNRTFAGFYFRTPGTMRFWGWGEPPAPAATPSTSLADWLRTVHALQGKTKPPQSTTTASLPAEHAELDDKSVRQTAKLGFRFVCNRQFVGLVIR